MDINKNINKALILKYDGKTNMTMITALLLFYLIIANNNLKTLYSGQLSQYIQNNRWIQHLIGFIMMLVIIILFAGVTDIYTAALYALIAYLWFVLTTKIDIEWNLLIFALLVVGFLYENNMLDKEKHADDDKVLTKEDKKKIRKNNNKIKKIIILSILVITLVGATLYGYKKYNQYGSEFDPLDFVFKEGKRYKLTKD